MQTIKRTLLALLFLGLSSGQVNALVINDGAVHAFSLSSTGGGYDLIVNGTVQVLGGFGTGSLTLQFVVDNDSTLNGGGAIVPGSLVRLTAFGFNITPNATGVSFSDVVDGGLVDAYIPGPGNPNLPSQPVEICAFAGPNCAGGGGGGIVAGGTDTFSLILAGTWGDTITLDFLAVKFQTDNGSFEFGCTNSECGPPVQVPEPHTLALLGLGLIGLALGRRRRAIR